MTVLVFSPDYADAFPIHYSYGTKSRAILLMKGGRRNLIMAFSSVPDIYHVVSIVSSITGGGKEGEGTYNLFYCITLTLTLSHLRERELSIVFSCFIVSPIKSGACWICQKKKVKPEEEEKDEQFILSVLIRGKLSGVRVEWRR